MIRLVLASSSPQRLSLLQQAGFRAHEILPTGVDETPLRGELPAHLTKRLAQLKLSAAQRTLLARENPSEQHQYVIIAADTVVSCGRTVIEPPANAQQAADNFRTLSGRSHRVTSVVAAATLHGPARVKTSHSRVVFKRLHPSEIDMLVAGEEWRGRAGGYAIQGRAGSIVRSINGSYSAVVGLPLLEATSLLRSFALEPTVGDING